VKVRPQSVACDIDAICRGEARLFRARYRTAPRPHTHQTWAKKPGKSHLFATQTCVDLDAHGPRLTIRPSRPDPSLTRSRQMLLSGPPAAAADPHIVDAPPFKERLWSKARWSEARLNLGLIEGPIRHPALVRRRIDRDRPLLVVAAHHPPCRRAGRVVSIYVQSPGSSAKKGWGPAWCGNSPSAKGYAR
jgi:hypothetical protein